MMLLGILLYSALLLSLTKTGTGYGPGHCLMPVSFGYKLSNILWMILTVRLSLAQVANVGHDELNASIDHSNSVLCSKLL